MITDGIKKRIEKAVGLWAEELINVLWSIRTTAKGATGETHFFMVYGAEAVLPIELYEPTLRVMLYNEEENWEAMKLALDFLPEKRGNASIRHEIYRLQMERAYNKRVKRRPLKVGDFVLRKMESIRRANEQGKLTPNWDDQYRIREDI